jgi:ATP/ADP translocase
MQVVAYGISINLVEVTWKSKIKQQFPNPNDYSAFMGNFSTATGTVTFLMMLLSRFVFRKFGWGVAALITPTVLLVTGVFHPHARMHFLRYSLSDLKFLRPAAMCVTVAAT